MGWKIITFDSVKAQICRDEDAEMVIRDHESRLKAVKSNEQSLGDWLHLKSDWFYDDHGMAQLITQTHRGWYSIIPRDADKVLERLKKIRKYGENHVKVYMGRHTNIIMSLPEYQWVTGWVESLTDTD